MLLAMGEVFALLLGEIDLSIGFVSGIGGIVIAELVKQSTGWPWWAAILVGAASPARRSALLQGTIITRVGLPSFVVTLAGLLGLAGRDAADPRARAASLPINDNVINDIASGNLTPAASWIVMIVIVGVVRRCARGCASRAGARQRPGRAAARASPAEDRGRPASPASCSC